MSELFDDIQSVPSGLTVPSHLRILSTRITHSVILLLGMGLATSAYLLRNTYYGDPTIYLIFARNNAQGDFFSFNPGHFSSGSTSPLWALVLAVPYLFSSNPMFAKLLSFLVVTTALLATYQATISLKGSKLAGAFSIAAMSFYLFLPGFQLYESALLVGLISLSIIGACRVQESRNTLPRTSMYLLVVAWMMIPLARPDAVVVSLITAVALMLKCQLRSTAIAVAAWFFVSLLPALLYFGYSKLSLGTMSVSSYCRAFALQEKASSFWGISYSLEPIRVLLTPPTILYIMVASLGIWWFRRSDGHRWFLAIAAFATVTYLVLLTLISPTTNDIKRYLLPVLSLLFPITAITAASIAETRIRTRHYAIPVLLFILMVIVPLAYMLRTSARESKRGLTFDEITDRQAVTALNEIAEPGSTVLAYEVQSRYYLRKDITLLSLDGIIDGKVGPYLDSGDMVSFLWRYRPEYWIANDAVCYRLFMSHSLLSTVLDEILQPSCRQVNLNGIRFTCIWRREGVAPSGFAAAEAIFRLEYISTGP